MPAGPAVALRRRRAAAQLLGEHAPRTPDDVVRSLLAVQAQDLRGARLALRARSTGLTAAAVDAALADAGGGVVRAWLCRGTLHLVAAEDHGWLLALTAPRQGAANRRRLGQEGVSPDDAERAVGVIERALADSGPLARRELAARVRAAGIRAEGQGMLHLLMLSALRGVVVLVGERAVALARDRLPRQRPVDRAAALAELARRYLRGHGPATAADLAYWSGLPLRDARAGLGGIASELRADGEHVDLAGRAGTPERIPPRLLPAYDPYLLGWRDRGFAVPAELRDQVHPGGGLLRAVAIEDGLVASTWSLRGGSVAGADPVRYADEIADIARFVRSAAG